MIEPRETLRRINLQGIGIFNASDWLEEGNGLLTSARIVRAAWIWKRRAFPERISELVASRRLWPEIKGLPRAAVLLLGYSIEMYLKAGLLSAYRGCPEESFSRDVRHKFRHNLLKIAQEIDFPCLQGDSEDLQELQQFIEDGARYPIELKDLIDSDTKRRHSRFSAHFSERTAFIWSDERFRQLSRLSNRVHAHVSRIDHDENNPSRLDCGVIGETGYWAFRIGGNLRPRVTYRLCPSLSTMSEVDVRSEVEKSRKFSMLTKWDECRIYEDKAQRLPRVKGPISKAGRHDQQRGI